MSSYKVTITKPAPQQDNSPASAPTETVIFTQYVEDLDVQKFIRDLNATPRRRKSRARPLDAQV